MNHRTTLFVGTFLGLSTLAIAQSVAPLSSAAHMVQQTGAAGIDWAGLALVITAIGGALGTLFSALGWTDAAKKAKEATAQTVAMVHGVENLAATEAGKAVESALADAGVKLENSADLTALVSAIQGNMSSHVKDEIKRTSMALDVGHLLGALVDRETTGKLSKAELQKRLEKEGGGA